MTTKRNDANRAAPTPTAHVGARIPFDLRERFREIALRDHRNVSQELQRLIEMRVAEAEKEAV